MITTQPFSANGRSYHPPARPVVVICIDGCGDEYLSTSIAQGRMPNVARMAKSGYRGFVRGALPSFTNVNNASIISGVAPSQTGICGNFFLNPETGEEVMMNSPQYFRCESILVNAAHRGRKVAFVTAKDKLRTVLGHGLVELGGIAFSSEKVDEARRATHGIEDVGTLVGRGRPEIYSGDASIYVLQAGRALVERQMADFVYLSLTDFMQHKYAPHEPESLEFYESMDAEMGRLLDLGAVLAATADHGMNAKNRQDGQPNVIYVESLLRDQFGIDARVICPITDPYVVHHGALGSLVMVHVAAPRQLPEIRAALLSQDGITEVYTRDEACAKLELAADRIGDLVVLGARDVVLGKTPEHHNLAVLDGGLRSHGGRYEEMVPLLLSEPLGPEYLRRSQMDPRNFDIFDFACHGTN